MLDSNEGLDQYQEKLLGLVEPERRACTVTTQKEKDAAKVIRYIRENERKVLFPNLATENVPPPDALDMGGQYLTNKARIEKESKLFEIAKLVPKGGLLHLHFNTELDPALLLQKAFDAPNMYIRSIRPLLTKDDLDQTEVVFSVIAKDKVNTDVDLFSQTYPGTKTNWKEPEWTSKVWMKWSCFQDGFKNRFPEYHATSSRATCPRRDMNPAESWVMSKIVLSADEVYGPSQTLNGLVSDTMKRNEMTNCYSAFGRGSIRAHAVSKGY